MSNLISYLDPVTELIGELLIAGLADRAVPLVRFTAYLATRGATLAVFAPIVVLVANSSALVALAVVPAV